MGKQQYKSKDSLGQHIRLYALLYNSPAWCALSTTAKALWVDMRAQISGYTNGCASCALGILSHKGWSSRHTVSRARNELEILGFIRLTKSGGIGYGGKTPNLYRFTDIEVYDQPKKRICATKADHLYQEFKTKSEALKRLSELEERKKYKVQKSTNLSAEITLSSTNLSAISIQ